MSNKKARTGEVQDVAADPWKHSCADVVSFRLVEGCTKEELKQEIAAGGKEFDAEFFHQHFGDDEEIKGYKNLSVRLWFSARTYHAWLDFSFIQKKMGADQLVKIFNEQFPMGVVRSKDEFISAVVAESAALVQAIQGQGEVCETVQPSGGNHEPVQIRRFTLAKAAQKIQDLHARFEPLLLFFIDGASLIEKGDDKWDALLAIQEKLAGPPLLLGLITLYNFWAYPQHSRTRLSQILVLPPYRDMGLGKAMLKTAYAVAKQQGSIDLTIEDPTPNLQRVREKLEVEMLSGSTWVNQQLQACAEACQKGESKWPEILLPPLPEQTIHPDQARYSQGGSTSATSSGVVNNAGRAAASSSRSSDDSAQEGPVACLTPPPSFITRITQEFKIYGKEARLVWEALLYTHPTLFTSDRGRQALQSMVQSRLETGAFAHCMADAERKQVVTLPGRQNNNNNNNNEINEEKKNENFIMMRVRPDSSSDRPAGDAAGQGVAQGRLNVTTISKEEKEQQLSDLCDERFEQLRTLKSLLSRNPHRTG